ncbi:hypothetical protein [Actinomadura craniellae]|uniref:hypothetical protein n=1 Tax=Actinomadura craniellae TaxID=2231787 RepID=UPI0011BF1DCC|nr:hypothetical protein [Actinomadura craniellae]
MNKSDRGEGSLSYIGVVLLMGAIVAGVLSSDVSGAIARGCEDAICRLTGGDCSKNQPQARNRGSGGGMEIDPLLKTRPGGSLDNFLPRPPIPKPTCNPDPGARWAEGLHAHNDYDNENPLDDALDNGATSVEADVVIDLDGQLSIKHDTNGKSQGSLKKLYIDPLMELAKKNGGQIYPGRDPSKPFQLVIELKEPQLETGKHHKWPTDEEARKKILDQRRLDAYWAAVRQTEILRTRYPNVQVVFSGGTPKDIVVGQPDPLTGKVPKNVFYDISPGKNCTLPPQVDPHAPRLPTDPPYNPSYAKNFVTLNGKWSECGDRNGDGKVSDEEQRKLNEIVQQAHAAGLKVRIWGGPDDKDRFHFKPYPEKFIPCFYGRRCHSRSRETAWQAQRDAGVDYLNTNHLTIGSDWIRHCRTKAPEPTPKPTSSAKPPQHPEHKPTHQPEPKPGPSPRP